MKILVTGGAGFIGSNLVRSLLQQPDIELVRVLDNLSTGHLRNLTEVSQDSRFQFIQGDIRSTEDCTRACKDIDAISHQAALGSVPRSIKDPLTSHDVNVNGFLHILEAARQQGIKRIVYASSSSVYGDLNESPKVEIRTGRVLSPYAATKMANELYAEAYSRNYGMQMLGLRYFNVFGPNQDPEGPYAAVVPLFIKAALRDEAPVINGDGTITRDFTPITNVIQVNTKGLLTPKTGAFHEVLNVACGQTTSLTELWQLIKDITGTRVSPVHADNRKGDILSSLANIDKAVGFLQYQPDKDLRNQMVATIGHYRQQF